MRKFNPFFSFLFAFFLFLLQHSFAQQTVGLFQYDPGTTDGYTLIAPNANTSTYLIDNCGRQVHEWTSTYQPGNVVYLLEDGSLLHTGRLANALFNAGGRGGRIELLDWNSNITWFYEYSDNNHCQHHDAKMLPNGNVIFIAWERKTKAQAIAQGRDSTTLLNVIWPDHIIEVEPTTPGAGNIVWEWHVWDHMIQDFDSTKPNFGVVADHPELIDLNFYNATGGQRDWQHTNAIAYNPTRDQIAISIHNSSEIWLIDHSTTTAEAASHSGGLSGKGGDLLYRWGNPLAYQRGTANDQQYWGQHDVEWIDAPDMYAGGIKVFNNGLNRTTGGNYSTVDIIMPPMNVLNEYEITPGQPYGPTSPIWSWQDNPPTNFFSNIISGAQRLPGNHTLLCAGTTGDVVEIDSAGNRIWEYINPVQGAGAVNQGDPVTNNGLFRAYRFLPTFAGLSGQVLTAGDPLEGNPLPFPAICDAIGNTPGTVGSTFTISPNPFNARFSVEFQGSEAETLQLFDSQGRRVFLANINVGKTEITTEKLPAGIYFARLGNGRSLMIAKNW